MVGYCKDTHRTLAAFALLSVLAALAALSVALAACDLPVRPGTAPPTAPAVSVIEPQPTILPTEPGTPTLVFWEPFPLDRPQGMLLAEMVHDYQVENPDFQIELLAKSGYLGIHDAMRAALADGGLPDLAVAFPSMIAQYAAAGVVLPLDALMLDPEWGLTDEDRADIYPNLLEAGRLPAFGGQMLAFPFAQNAIGLWLNRSLLAQAGWKEPPATWMEFEQACFDVWAASGVRCLPYVESVSSFYAWLYSRGSGPLDASGGRAAFNGPEGVESLNLLRRLIDAGLAWVPQDPYGDYAAFASGQAAFAFSSTGNAKLTLDAYQGALERGMPPFEFGQALIPQADPAQPATALYGSSFFIVRSEPERERAAWRLIHWFTAQAQTARWAASLEAMPVRASALAVMTDTLQADPYLQAQVEGILPYGRPEPGLAVELDIREILYTSIISVTQGYSNAQSALDVAAVKVNVLLGGE
jgi:ABC-type glycerol-3-phosphate transport system substrate-binding protein